jgi:hypothetical protein
MSFCHNGAQRTGYVSCNAPAQRQQVSILNHGYKHESVRRRKQKSEVRAFQLYWSSQRGREAVQFSLAEAGADY